jgi:hypothetical protein
MNPSSPKNDSGNPANISINGGHRPNPNEYVRKSTIKDIINQRQNDVNDLTDRRKTTEKGQPERRNSFLTKTFQVQGRTHTSSDNPFDMVSNEQRTSDGLVQVQHSAMVEGSNRRNVEGGINNISVIHKERLDNSILSGRSNNTSFVKFNPRKSMLVNMDNNSTTPSSKP